MTEGGPDHGVPHRGARTALFADPAFKAFLVKGLPHFSRQENFILRPTSFWRA
jgi:hypothetical protein